MTLAAGSKLGPYSIESMLGAGGMGEVYRARDSRLGREVAIKVLPESFSKDADRLRRFEQEARAVAALNHPNILAIHDIGEQNGTHYLVSELLEGSSLRLELDHGAVIPRKAGDYAAQIAQGLAAAHDKNIIHRDLKPENIFITREGRVKILDFGLAKLAPAGNLTSPGVTLTSSPTEAGVVMGTVGYMAPEQVRGTSVDSRTDIFAFGAVLYEMLSGNRAFRRDTAAETMTAILKEDPPELAEVMSTAVSPGMERIVRRCLEKNPEQRFQSAKDLAFALESLTGTTVKSGTAIAIPEARKISPWFRIAAAAVAGLAFGAAVIWFLRPGPPPPSTFTRISFHRGEVVEARFAPDGKTVVYSARLNGDPLDTYIIRNEYPEPVPAGLHGAALLSVSRQGQLAVLVQPHYFAHRQWVGTLATSPLGGGAPRELLENVRDADWSPDGNELAVLAGPLGSLRIEYPLGKVLKEFPNWLSDIRVSPDGNHIALFRHPPSGDDRGDVILLDRSGNLSELSKGWESLEGLTWAPSGKEVWFSAAETGEQYCIHAVTLAGKQRTVYCGMSPTLIHDISPSGTILVSGEEHRVSMELVEHGSATPRNMDWLNSPYWPLLSTDGSEMVFTDQSENASGVYAVYARKTDGSPAVRIGSGGFATSLSADGKWALVILPGDPAAKMQIVPVGAGQTRVLHWDGIKPLWGYIWPDSEHFAFFAEPTSQGLPVYLTDINGATPKLLLNVTDDIGPVSPDQRTLIVRQKGVWSLHSLADGAETPIPVIAKGEHPLGWSADSKAVYTRVVTSHGAEIYKIDLNTSHRELWQTLTPEDQIGLRPVAVPPSITPDGRWIAYTYSNQLGQLYRSDSLK